MEDPTWSKTGMYIDKFVSQLAEEGMTRGHRWAVLCPFKSLSRCCSCRLSLPHLNSREAVGCSDFPERRSKFILNHSHRFLSLTSDYRYQ